MKTAPPKGIGLYVRRLTRKRHLSPREFAKKCAEYRIQWLALGGPWHDKRGEKFINPPETIEEYAYALHDVGVSVHIWGYPWHDRIDMFIEHMSACTSEVIQGWLLNPEIGLKKHPKEASELFKKARASNPYRILGMSSYGIPQAHKTFPFDAFAEKDMEGDPSVECDYGSCQLYAMSRQMIHRGMKSWDRLGFDHVVPSFGNYKWVSRGSGEVTTKNRKAVPLSAAELRAHLTDFTVSSVQFDAMVGWAENFVTTAQWKELSKWAKRYEETGSFSP
jgi:hypothetical protein